jgi:methylamine dehydrogenase heavy chain
MELDESGRYLLVFNLTPATSVSVIDVIDRKFIGEIDTPGCSFIFPTGRAGFSSICADGSMMSIQLNPQGLVASRETTESFFDVETDPLFAEAALVDNFGYFPTFGGDIQEVDLSDSIAKPGLKWPLTQSDGSDSGWRPGGLQLIDSDSKGNIYVLMHPRGDSSSHKDGGKEVWIFDRESRKRISKLELQTWSISLSVVGEAGSEYLVTSNVRKNLDVYDLQTLEYVKSMERFAQDTPLIIVYNPH